MHNKYIPNVYTCTKKLKCIKCINQYKNVYKRHQNHTTIRDKNIRYGYTISRITIGTECVFPLYSSEMFPHELSSVPKKDFT